MYRPSSVGAAFRSPVALAFFPSTGPFFVLGNLRWQAGVRRQSAFLCVSPGACCFPEIVRGFECVAARGASCYHGFCLRVANQGFQTVFARVWREVRKNVSSYSIRGNRSSRAVRGIQRSVRKRVVLPTLVGQDMDICDVVCRRGGRFLESRQPKIFTIERGLDRHWTAAAVVFLRPGGAGVRASSCRDGGDGRSALVGAG